jgi:hypothetical protein
MCSVFALFDLSIIVVTDLHTSLEFLGAQDLHSVENEGSGQHIVL